MMVAIFAMLTLALLCQTFAARRLRWLGVATLIVSLALSTCLFLWEIYSPQTGFRLPWLQVRIHTPAKVAV